MTISSAFIDINNKKEYRNRLLALFESILNWLLYAKTKWLSYYHMIITLFSTHRSQFNKKKSRYACQIENLWDYDLKLHRPMHNVYIHISVLFEKSWALMWKYKYGWKTKRTQDFHKIFYVCTHIQYMGPTLLKKRWKSTHFGKENKLFIQQNSTL